MSKKKITHDRQRAIIYDSFFFICGNDAFFSDNISVDYCLVWIDRCAPREIPTAFVFFFAAVRWRRRDFKNKSIFFFELSIRIKMTAKIINRQSDQEQQKTHKKRHEKKYFFCCGSQMQIDHQKWWESKRFVVSLIRTSMAGETVSKH